MNKTFDICIIGAGAGGSTLAYALLKQSKNIRIALIEKSCDEDILFTKKLFGVPITQYSGLGGTSQIWGGACLPIEKKEFSSWPIDYKEIREYYNKSLDLLGLENLDFYKEAIKNIDLQSDIRKLISQDFLTNELQPRVVQQLLPAPNLFNLFNLSKSNNITLFNGFKGINLEQQNERITLLNASNGKKKIAIRSKKFVLCCGALNTPALLLNSRRLSNNIHFKNPNIGKFLSDHPMSFLAQIQTPAKIRASYLHRVKVDKKIRHKVGFGIMNNDSNITPNFYLIPSFSKKSPLKTEEIKKAMLTIKEKSLSISNILKLIVNPGIVLQIIYYLWINNPKVNVFDIWFIAEQTPNINSYVDIIEQLNDYKLVVNWEILENDYEDFLKDINSFLNILEKSHNKITHRPSLLDLKNCLTSASHHMSTCKMASSHRSGVVDGDLKMFDTENLYICDASVIPKSGHSNPTLTIMSLALRLAENIDV